MQSSVSSRYDLERTLEGFRSARRWLLVVLMVATPIAVVWETFSHPAASAPASRMEAEGMHRPEGAEGLLPAAFGGAVAWWGH
jgi:hypothetical protein